MEIAPKNRHLIYVFTLQYMSLQDIIIHNNDFIGLADNLITLRFVRGEPLTLAQNILKHRYFMLCNNA